jgi:hypothetical protein
VVGERDLLALGVMLPEVRLVRLELTAELLADLLAVSEHLKLILAAVVEEGLTYPTVPQAAVQS